MTLHYWNAEIDPGHSATIYWDKDLPALLTATISRDDEGGLSDVIARKSAANNDAGFADLVAWVREVANANKWKVGNITQPFTRKETNA